ENCVADPEQILEEYTHIVAVDATGNMFCYEANKDLNHKTKNWIDFLGKI
ncbi:hypothetical protein FRX31_018059, partial [Thalictrum thalictroides]